MTVYQLVYVREKKVKKFTVNKMLRIINGAIANFVTCHRGTLQDEYLGAEQFKSADPSGRAV